MSSPHPGEEPHPSVPPAEPAGPTFSADGHLSSSHVGTEHTQPVPQSPYLPYESFEQPAGHEQTAQYPVAAYPHESAPTAAYAHAAPAPTPPHRRPRTPGPADADPAGWARAR
uniref:Uncharacterized protein n=1 Tax=Janibacter limosus TaxID=53458 RepID=A0AC61U6S3_9MICO|nr:hypothetical protein [Janibacter limosus]